MNPQSIHGGRKHTSAPRLFLAHYRLRNGTRGTLHLVCRASFDAVDIALDTFGDQLARISVRPAA